MRIRSIRIAAVLALLGSSAAFPTAAAADAADEEGVRRAVERGEIRPLSQILESLRGTLPGEVLRVDVERRKGRWFYEFRVIGPGGRLFEVYVDAGSGEVERVKEK